MLEGPDVAVGDVDPEDVSQQLQVAVSHSFRDLVVSKRSLT